MRRKSNGETKRLRIQAETERVKAKAKNNRY